MSKPEGRVSLTPRGAPGHKLYHRTVPTLSGFVSHSLWSRDRVRGERESPRLVSSFLTKDNSPEKMAAVSGFQPLLMATGSQAITSGKGDLGGAPTASLTIPHPRVQIFKT